jgi:pilus assembly protein CpaB
MQNRRTTIFFALAILFGIAAATLAQRMLSQPASPAPQAAIETKTVIVARLEVNKGSALTSSHLDTVEWPVNLVPKGTFSGKDAVEGRVLRHSLAAGEPIFELALLPKGSDAGLVSVISHNLRAVSVKVDAIIGVAGFVTPGSRVDVLATFRQSGSDSKNSISKVILQNVPVLAIDQKMEEVKNGEPELVSVVTLEVSPEQAEELTYSAHEGRLQLALRSPADSDIATTHGVSASDLMPRKKTAPSRVAYTNVEVVKGAAVSVKAY